LLIRKRKWKRKTCTSWQGLICLSWSLIRVFS